MKKIVIFILVLIGITGLVRWKQQVVVANREQEIVSPYMEWARHGKPVVVQTVQRTDVPEYTKFTVQQKNGAVYEGYVTQVVKQRLKAGQPVFINDGARQVQGNIVVVSTDLIVETGLYYVRISLKEALTNAQPFYVCFATTRMHPNAINIPSEVADYVDGQYRVWVASQEGLAEPREITLTSSNGFGFNVQQGLRAGDQLIISGQSMLIAGDKVQIIARKD
jgi:hypothetical protein